MSDTEESPPVIGPCKWFISIQEPECGTQGVAKVRIGGRAGQVTVDLCAKHKAQHDVTFARIRTAHERGPKYPNYGII